MEKKDIVVVCKPTDANYFIVLYNNGTMFVRKSNMEHPLRITHKNSDYTFKLIKDSPVTKETTEFKIRLDEEEIFICKTPTGWAQKDSGPLHLDPELLNAIGHSLSLRFRLS